MTSPSGAEGAGAFPTNDHSAYGMGLIIKHRGTEKRNHQGNSGSAGGREVVYACSSVNPTHG